MRIAALLAATAVALTMTACNRSDDTVADPAMTEADEASGAAVDASAMTTEESAAAAAAAANAPVGSNPGQGQTQGQTMDPGAGTGSVSEGAMAPGAMAGDTAGNNVTETERRLNPPTAPAQ